MSKAGTPTVELASRLYSAPAVLSTPRTSASAPLRDDPLNGLTSVQVGVCLHASGDRKAALERFHQALELNERNFLAHLNVALWMLEENRIEDAAAAADAACTI